jgi:hypothetical protein
LGCGVAKLELASKVGAAQQKLGCGAAKLGWVGKFWLGVAKLWDGWRS